MQWKHTVEYHSALKKEGILTLASKIWVDFEDIMPSEISQSLKDKYCPSSSSSQREKENGAGRGRRNRHCLVDRELEFYKMKQVTELDVDGGDGGCARW